MSDETVNTEDAIEDTTIQDSTGEVQDANPDGGDASSEETPDYLQTSGADQETPTPDQEQDDYAPDYLKTGAAQFQYAPPRGMALDQQQHTGLAEFTNAIASRAGIQDPKLAQGLFEAVASQMRHAEQNQRQQMAAAHEALRTELEREVGQAEANKIRGRANTYVRHHGGEKLAELLVQHGLNNHPTVLRFFANAGPKPEPANKQPAKADVAVPATLHEAILLGNDAVQAYRKAKSRN